MPFRFPRATVAIVLGASALVPLMGNDLATREMKESLLIDPTPANLEALRKAIADGADIHSPMRMFPHPETPLACAVELKDGAAVRVLLDAGAKVDSQASGAPPDQGASYTCDFSALMYAVWPDLNNLMDGLFTGPERGSLAMVRLLCQRGADPDAGTDFGDTPLMLAVETGQPALVAEFLKWGADPTRRRPRGGRALDRVPLFIPPSQVGPHPLRDPCTALMVDHLKQQKGERKQPVALAGPGDPKPVPPVERKETDFDRLGRQGGGPGAGWLGGLEAAESANRRGHPRPGGRRGNSKAPERGGNNLDLWSHWAGQARLVHSAEGRPGRLQEIPDSVGETVDGLRRI